MTIYNDQGRVGSFADRIARLLEDAEWPIGELLALVVKKLEIEDEELRDCGVLENDERTEREP